MNQKPHNDQLDGGVVVDRVTALPYVEIVCCPLIMASLFSVQPQCVSCIRRALTPFRTSSFQQQTRSKKKLAKPSTTIKVKLVRDVPRFGRSGETLIQLSPSLFKDGMLTQAFERLHHPRRRRQDAQ